MYQIAYDKCGKIENVGSENAKNRYRSRKRLQSVMNLILVEMLVWKRLQSLQSSPKGIQYFFLECFQSNFNGKQHIPRKYI